MYSLGPGTTQFRTTLFRQGGYPEIVGDGPTKAPQVLLRMFDGPQPTYYEINNAIGKSGQDRNQAWLLIDHHDRIRPLQGDRFARNDGNSPDEDGTYDRLAKLNVPKYELQRWILTFRELEDAKSFVRCWHRRPFPWGRRSDAELERHAAASVKYGKQVTMVD